MLEISFGDSVLEIFHAKSMNFYGRKQIYVVPLVLLFLKKSDMDLLLGLCI